MANSDKNIVITPNIGSSSADPRIVFSGANASLGPQNITLQVYPTNNGTLSFEGSAGQLFSITNSMSGTIFSANDVSGIPSIEVLDTGLVKLAQYSGNVLVGTGTDNGTDKLQVNGTIIGTVVKGTTIRSTVATGTAPLTIASTTMVNNLNAEYLSGLLLHAGRNNEANKVVRTDGSGYIQCGYINSSNGDENNASFPSRVWGTNGSDSYMRTYQASQFATSGHNHTYNVNNEWLRDNGDDNQFKIYGNSRTVIYRTDGNTNDHGGGPYAHIFYYGGSADANREFIINTDGTLWAASYGWLHERFASFGKALIFAR